MDGEEKSLQPSTSKAIKNEQSDEENDEIQGYETDSSSGDSDSVEKCPICLLKFGNDQEIGKPATCEHAFCFPCIEEWSKVVRTCPIDRKEFAKINVYGNLEDNNLLRTVLVGEQISLKDYTATEADEYTACEVCRSIEREDVMLLCDGCDKGFHMDCLDPPILTIPIDNWYCQECESMESSAGEEEEETDLDELNDLQEEINNEIGNLPLTRLRDRPQPQIVRTLQSERIRNAIIARRSLRGLNNIQQPTSSTQQVTAVKRKSPVKKRRSYRRKRSTVVEYEIREGGGKFPIKTIKKRKARKRRKKKRVSRRAGRTTSKIATNSARSFCANQNVFDLQHARQQAGVSNFNIFEPTNLLDYVPDEEEALENDPYFSPLISNTGSSDGLLIQGAINNINPIRRQALIKKRVIDNFTTTSSSCDLLDSILNAKHFFEKPCNRVNFTGDVKVTKAADGNTNTCNEPKQVKSNESNRGETTNNLQPTETSQPSTSSNQNLDINDINTEQPSVTLNFGSSEKSPPKKKKPAFDMFQETTPERDECPNFSIYNLGDTDEHENIEANLANPENFDDLVQMSDEGEQLHSNVASEDIEPVVIFKSQPASPDLENEGEQERSYTPPLVKVETQKEEKKSLSSRKSKKQSRRQELERYNVRERLREKTPLRTRDRYGRNRTRSRSNTRSRSRHRRKSKSNERKNRRKSRSDSRKRDSSDDRRRNKKQRRRKSIRKSRSHSRSASPHRRRNCRDEKSPKRQRKRDRTPSPSEKSKKKKYRTRSRERPSGALTKEIYTSGQNILVSLNFSNQTEKRSPPSTSHENKEPIVDITAKKKINVSSKPVAIIDLARSPFRELTPEYKKESNVIELSDSEGEKHASKPPPKSPDSTKLYDPFDILNSPSNENVSSSQQNIITNLKAIERETKGSVQSAAVPQKSVPIHTSEENLVTSSSNAFEKIFPARVANKIEVLQKELVQTQNTSMTIESPYSPGANDDVYQDSNIDEDGNESTSFSKPNLSSKSGEKLSANLYDELFGSSSPPGLDRIKGSKKSSSDPSNKYINKLKRQERVIEEVKGAIKPHYSKRAINKEQYKEIMRKAVPKICHSKTGEINPTKIKHLVDSYVKFYTHKKKRPEIDETL